MFTQKKKLGWNFQNFHILNKLLHRISFSVRQAREKNPNSPPLKKKKEKLSLFKFNNRMRRDQKSYSRSEESEVS
ncbi:hypothetical protein RJT34_20075 [Clitoria ternatea]|uniref:Uncharacterized protein n=1 Tax=Clitoria ternatea TaxID=43366 RepID=A0AAN9IS62_CLITE